MHDDPLATAARRRIPTGVFQRTRYVVGIDLGTTNSALAYVDRRAGVKAREVRHFPVEQLAEPGITKPGRVLPSAVYLRGEHELSPAQLQLPWRAGEHPCVIGQLARKRGALTPDRLITSSKSWLCHAGVDRTAPILPWGAPESIPRRSPVEVLAEILRHLRDAWNHAQAQEDETRRLERQDLVVTIPASFDEVARELTVMATRQAGLDALLIEEPQAALYAWIARHEETWAEQLRPGERILVVDVGGGTSDFSLFEVTPPAPDASEEDQGKPGFVRTAVGDHLLLGGDNMDLTLARQVEARLGQSLDLRGWHALVQACREAKETLLEGGEPVAQVAIAGKGSKLIGGTLRAEVRREDVLQTILEGFFPACRADEAPSRGGAGLREFGLPFESDPAITRHLAAFLRRHGEGDALPRIDHVLFNGGVFRTRLLRERVLDALAGWQAERPHELEGADLDLAVSLGAAYYGLVRRGKGTRIKSGAGRAYYLEVRAAAREERTALCLIPRGLDEGGVVTIAEHPLELQANRPVVFPFWTSTSRDDAAGAVVGLNAEFDELAPLHTVIRAGKKRTARVRTVPVELVARYTELGTLEMWAQSKEDPEKRWRLELDTRPREATGASGPAQPAEPVEDGEVASGAAAAPDQELPPEQGLTGVDPAALDKARKQVIRVLRMSAAEAGRPLEQLAKELEELLGGSREGWSVPVIRALFDVLLEERGARRRSPAHEARWANLAGFCLRPGFGAALDFGRVSAMWKVYLEGMAHPGKDAVRLEWWVAFRRIAGGLHRGQQETLFAPTQPHLLGHKHEVQKQELAEMWRLAANLEHLAPKKKKQLGDVLLALLEKGKGPPRWGPWALGRFGGRVPLYGPLDRLVSADVAAGWLDRLLAMKGSVDTFAVVQLARLTGDRARDIAPELRERALARLREQNVEPRTLRPLEEVVTSEVRTQAEFYGDSVPIGLVLQASS